MCMQVFDITSGQNLSTVHNDGGPFKKIYLCMADRAVVAVSKVILYVMINHQVYPKLSRKTFVKLLHFRVMVVQMACNCQTIKFVIG